MTTIYELRQWFQDGLLKKDCTHMIVVCDTFDYEDYPVYVTSDENVKERVADHSKDMQKVMEVYDLRKPMEEQMKGGTRVFNY